ncbi:MAG TPA: DUF4450 domain-containing protein [Candidatus Hydrogenedentes bacterium]|nr:DUF4450 domain-containing protein [Candidatus Hydrogenedentota bacterium]
MAPRHVTEGNTLVFWAFFVGIATSLAGAPHVESGMDLNTYVPVERGWRIRITTAAPAERAPTHAIGQAAGDPRGHRRPLYPPADKSLIWDDDELKSLERCGFRPLVLAYNEPRFLLDLHSAGGLLGHLYVGLTQNGRGKWFHQWAELTVRYADGRMTYHLRDPAFPDLSVSIEALPLADAAGLVARVKIKGPAAGAELVWAFGGASAFATNYSMSAREFTFAPEHCAKDTVEWIEERFVLHRSFDESDVCMKEVSTAARHLPGWCAEIEGASSWAAEQGFGAPDEFSSSPLDLVASADWTRGRGARRNCVAVQRARLSRRNARGYIVVGVGRNMAEVSKDQHAAWRAASERSTAIAQRVVVTSPDPYLDAAVGMMAFSTEGTWGDLAILHGGWSWRQAYLGWRGWYGSNCYGWTDRVRRSIESHTTLGLARTGEDAGALSSKIEHEPSVYYNMNEVFLDQVRHYFDYTNDLDLMRDIYPILEGVVAWENRRLQPGGEGLYENSLNTWISDSHWYIEGQCTQASAYMLRAHAFLADLARRLGHDPGPYAEQARRIRAAMQEKLWMPDAGVFAEYLDTRGHRLLHPEPELPTIYHAAEFGAADSAQVSQMLHWVDANLRSETTPGDGRLVWSSNWFPNRGRSYTHSTYELAYAENFNLALTYYAAGRADDAYALLRGALCGIFNGRTPGGLACHANVEGKQRGNDEFADAISMWGRAVLEGLFGIVARKPDDRIVLSPQFPCDWPQASIRATHFSYRWQRKRHRRDGSESVRISWQTPHATTVSLRLPVPAEAPETVRVNGRRSDYTVEGGFDGVNWVCVDSPKARRGHFQVAYRPASIEPAPAPVKRPDALRPVWTPPRPAGSGNRDLAPWTLIDLSEQYNAPVQEVLGRVVQQAKPPALPASRRGFGYRRTHLVRYHRYRDTPVCDAAWRAKVGPDGVAWTTDGIPFKTAKEGPNIAVATLAGAFPEAVDVPVHARGKALFLMISGMTFPVQSHVPNLRVRLAYADGSSAATDLVNPFSIGDCWGSWCGRYHDTPANGFENIGGRHGPAGSAEVDDLNQPIAVDTEAHLIRFDLRPDVALDAIRIEAVANDAIFGLMGASILK